jgi:hypothetical protein
MNKIKRIVIEETAKILKEMKSENRFNKTAINLYEAVKTAEVVKNNPRKHMIANKLVSVSENQFMKERQRLKENHGIEDESEMAKAQLLAIMEKAKELYQMLGDNIQLEDWVQYKLSIAENYMDAIHGYMKYFNGGDEMESEKIDDNEWDDVEEEEFDDFDDENFEEFDDLDDEDFDEFADFDDEEDEEFYDDTV